MIADGATPADAAGKLGVNHEHDADASVADIRQNGAISQPALVRFVSNLSMPVRIGAAHCYSGFDSFIPGSHLF